MARETWYCERCERDTNSGLIGRLCSYCMDQEEIAERAPPPPAGQDGLVEELVAALELVLPLAKGYAAEHRVGSNARYVAAADAALARAREETRRG